jgi:hypothetical protein
MDAVGADGGDGRGTHNFGWSRTVGTVVEVAGTIVDGVDCGAGVATRIAVGVVAVGVAVIDHHGVPGGL